jgi:ATP-binding cassette subfamily F protein 3
MITASNVSLAFGQRELFKNISFSIEKNQKIGLVGRNGSGKSTLLKVLCDQQGIDEGQISVEKHVKIAYLPQEVVLTSQRSILDEALTTFGSLVDLNYELEALKAEKELSPAQLEHFVFLQNELSDKNFDQLIVQAKKMLTALGFEQNRLQRPVTELSVGWKMRLVLAKLLLQKADFYLFDEPTNHLDIVAKDWFLDFLKHSNTGFILISHDRFFLDELCENIFEIERGNLKIYKGNYSSYLEQKEKDETILLAQFQAQQKHIKKTTDLINRFRAKASKANMAQSLLKSLEKIELIEIEPKPPKVRLNFSNVKRTGDIVLSVKNICKSFNSQNLFKNVSFDIVRGDKVALVAANGKGKTSLLNLITGKYPNECGTIKFGHNVEPVFFEQDQEASLNKNRTVLEEAESICTTSEMRLRVRGLLGAFLFSGDDVEKRISVLSGGEKNRVAMVKILLKDANFLILDEPTNHLDIQTKEILLDALTQYPGTILFVSHDRTFIDKLATRVLELLPDKIINYPGNYESYLYHKKQVELQGQTRATPEKANITEPKKSSSSKEWYEQKKRLGFVERKIDSLEKELLELNQKFEALQYASDEFQHAFKRINEIKEQLDSLYKEWEELQEKIS